jgi:hypothetical protein
MERPPNDEAPISATRSSSASTAPRSLTTPSKHSTPTGLTYRERAAASSTRSASSFSRDPPRRPAIPTSARTLISRPAASSASTPATESTRQ